MDWHFPKSDPAGEANIASYSRTVIEGERTISGLEIFVREVLQNSLDAAKDTNQKVTVQLRIRTLQGAALTTFFQAVNWPALKRYATAASRASSQRMDRYRFPDPAALEQGVVRVLEINESNTIGLIGPDRMIREEDYRTWPGETPKAYRALCRDDARREKVSLGSGGTFGLGKAVLWRASAIQIRGQGMVIGYQKLTGNTRIKPFVGLALGGRVSDQSDSGIQGDMLLGFSEHVTHTRWDEDAEALDTWPNSRARVRDLLSRMRGYFIRVAGNERRHQPEI